MGEAQAEAEAEAEGAWSVAALVKGAMSEAGREGEGVGGTRSAWLWGGWSVRASVGWRVAAKRTGPLALVGSVGECAGGEVGWGGAWRSATRSLSGRSTVDLYRR